MQGVIHAIEVVEQSGHRGELHDLAFIVMPAEALEQLIGERFRMERELARILEGHFLGIAERPLLELQQPLELLFRRAVPRSLRGV